MPAIPSNRPTDRKVLARRTRTDTTVRSALHRDFQDPERAIEEHAGSQGYIRDRGSFAAVFPASVAGSAATSIFTVSLRSQ